MMNAFCASENLLAFIRFRSSPSQESVAENSSFKRSSFRGSDQPEGADDMKKSRFTEAQIIGMIKEQEAGLPTAELCRKHGLSPATFYKLKAKYGGMDLSDAKRLKQLEDENAKLKRLVADVMLDNVVLKDLLGKP
jgi:putative transposase